VVDFRFPYFSFSAFQHVSFFCSGSPGARPSEIRALIKNHAGGAWCLRERAVPSRDRIASVVGPLSSEKLKAEIWKAEIEPETCKSLIRGRCCLLNFRLFRCRFQLSGFSFLGGRFLLSAFPISVFDLVAFSP